MSKDLILDIDQKGYNKIDLKYMKKVMCDIDLDVNVKNKNIYIIIEGERIYIKLLTIPRVRKSKIYDLVKGELEFYFKNIKDIAFDYSILKKSKYSIDVLIFCINTSKINKMEKMICNNQLKKVNLVQLLFFKYIKDKIKIDNYMIVLYTNSNLYILDIVNKNIIQNSVIRNFKGDKQQFLNELNEIENNNYDLYKINIKNIYFINFEYEEIKTYLDLTYVCKYYDIDNKDMLKLIIN